MVALTQIAQSAGRKCAALLGVAARLIAFCLAINRRQDATLFSRT